MTATRTTRGRRTGITGRSKVKKGSGTSRTRTSTGTSDTADERRCEGRRAFAEPDARGKALCGASPLLFGRE